MQPTNEPNETFMDIGSSDKVNDQRKTAYDGFIFTLHDLFYCFIIALTSAHWLFLELSVFLKTK